jgi:hypothetical protein
MVSLHLKNLLFFASQSSAGETNNKFYLVTRPARKNPTSSDLANETIIPCLLVCHQKQTVNNAHTYLYELLHCLLGEKK